MANVVWHEGDVTRKDRCRFLKHNNKVIWFTGLSGSGKSTIARAVEKKLYEKKILCYVLDGDNIRHGLNSDLDFSAQHREENIRRIAEVAKLFYDAGLYVLVSFISPYNKDRAFARSLIGQDFVEVFVDCPLDECEKRDSKGMYKKARTGEIKDFTGIDDSYEEPKTPEIVIDSKQLDVSGCAQKVLSFLQ